MTLPNSQVHHSFVREARKRIQQRINTKLTNLSKIESRMLKAVVVGQDHTVNPKDLKAKVHLIVNRTQSIRTKSRKHFSKQKDKWIESAKKRGAKKPERDVFKKQRERLSGIDQAEHWLIHRAFNKHGRSMPLVQDQSQSVTQEFNQAMG